MAAALAPALGDRSALSAESTAPTVALQQQRTFAFDADGVQITNDFAGGAFADLRRLGPDRYAATIAPENKPINRSPWYAMRITAAERKTVTIVLEYAHGSHRYRPKISRDGRRFVPIDGQRYQHDKRQGTATCTVDVGPEPVWVAAQELFTANDYQRWMDRLAQQDAIELQAIGQSPGGRTLHLLSIGERPAWRGDTDGGRRFVILFGRQHPPELSGAAAMRAFVEALAADNELAGRFRRALVVLAFPLINPDGVDHGFWRHNFGGKDLNRDWGPFTQPETAQVRDAISQHMSHPNDRVLVGIDFHSTFRNVFYTPSRNAPFAPKSFVADWLGAIRQRHPDVKLPESASHNPNGTTAKAWFVERFGAPGITYEVADDFDRATTRAIARTAAEAMMRRLLAEVAQPANEPVLQP